MQMMQVLFTIPCRLYVRADKVLDKYSRVTGYKVNEKKVKDYEFKH